MTADAFEAHRNARATNALRLYLVFMEPADGAGDRSAIRPKHFAFVEKLEADGHLVAGGPIVDDKTNTTTGRGMFIMRGASAEAVEEMMREEPFYQAGLRQFTVKPWRLAEGEMLALLKTTYSAA